MTEHPGRPKHPLAAEAVDLLHKVRGPLTEIRGIAELVSREKNLTDRQRRDLEGVLASAGAVQETLNRLRLTVAKLEDELGR